jgi:hypothetical protein
MIDWGNWRQSRNKQGEDKLAFNRGIWVPVKEQKSGVFLCEWDEKDYEKRNAHLKTSEKLPFEVIRFAYNGKMFVLFNCNLVWYAAQRVCELLGGRLACPDTPESSEYIRKKLAGYDQFNILLGGYRKWNDWYWLSGKKATVQPQRDKDQPIPTQNQNFITLRQGVFYNSQYGGLFLGEFPESSFSPNSR